MKIRPETPNDHAAIRIVNDEAFGEPIEAALVDTIRETDRFVPELSQRFGFRRADAAGVEAPEGARGPQYFMLRPLAAYDPGFRGRAVYPPETFGTVI